MPSPTGDVRGSTAVSLVAALNETAWSVFDSFSPSGRRALAAQVRAMADEMDEELEATDRIG